MTMKFYFQLKWRCTWSWFQLDLDEVQIKLKEYEKRI